MQDKSSNGISDTLRQYIEAVVMEVVLEGIPFGTQKKYLRRFCEAEGVDFDSFETDLYDFFERLEEYKKRKSQSGEHLLRLLGKDLFITEEVMEKLIGGGSPTPVIPDDVTCSSMEFVDLQMLLRNGKLQETKENGRVITPCGWKYVGDFHEGLARVEDADGEGYLDAMGNVVIPCQWGGAQDFSESLALVENKNREYFFIDKYGKVVITCAPGINPFQRCQGFHEGLAVVEDENKGKFGFIDKSGRMAIPCKWHDADSFENGLAAVMGENEKWGCIDRNGRLVIPCLYDEDMIFYDGIANVTTDDYENNFCIDSEGNKLFDWNQGSNTICFKEGLASIEENGFIDENGDFVIDGKWSPEWLGFSEGLAPTNEGYIDHSGRVVIPGDWEDCHEFKEGLAWVQKNDKWGYVDRNGRMVMPFIWDYANDFSEGLAIVQLENRFYIINKQGKVLSKVTAFKHR